jgi:ATP-dependent DNA helicase RecQ
MSDARHALQRHFGFPDFRPPQRRVVEAVLAGHDVLAVLPTGAGKSACFQIPAMLVDGLTVVVSPLISLMADQVAACRRRGIPAAALTSTSTPDERRLVRAGLADGALRLLYLSPERLGSFASSLRGGPRMALLAVDEAHCISEWGPDFRPAFRGLGALRQLLGTPPTVALTGSATPTVRDDIRRVLGLGAPQRECRDIVASFDRPNLYFAVARLRCERDRMRHLLAALDASEPLAIVYAPTRNVTEALTRALRFAGFDTVPYHAGLAGSYRQEALERFSTARLHVVVATCAFGMGIDAPNVRLVVHWSMPPTVEAYYQEAGRAGRDGSPAKCLLLHRDGDATLLRHELDTTFPSPQVVQRLWTHPDTLRAAPKGLRDSVERLRQELQPGRGAVNWAPVLARRRVAEQRITSMERYTSRRACRRAMLLEYFGEVAGHCSGCDMCGCGPSAESMRA